MIEPKVPGPFASGPLRFQTPQGKFGEHLFFDRERSERMHNLRPAVSNSKL